MPTPPPVVRAVILAWGALFLLDFALGLFGMGVAGALALDPLALLGRAPFDGPQLSALPGALGYVAVHGGFAGHLLPRDALWTATPPLTHATNSR